MTDRQARRVLRRYPGCAPSDVGRASALRRLRAQPADWFGERAIDAAPAGVLAGDAAEWLRPWVERAAAGENLTGAASALPVETVGAALRRARRAVWRWLVADMGGARG